MNLSAKQKTNIRHFIYYLVNGTLDFELLNSRIQGLYYEKIKQEPSLFFKACCVFINQAVTIDSDWPQVKRIAQYLCKEIDPINNSDLNDLELWELDYQITTNDLSGEFKSFTKWFIETAIVKGVSFINYMDDGATFVEQCYAIWSNVIMFDKGICTNSDYTRSRVSEYICAYYLGHQSSLENWECELW